MKKIYMILAAMTLLTLSLNAQTKATITVASSDFSDASWWTIISDNLGNTWSVTDGAGYYHYSSSYAADDWLVTSPITLDAGKTYTFKIDTKAQSATWPEKLEVKMATANSAAALSSGTSIIGETTISNTSYSTLSNTFTVPASGNYYFGIHCISDANQYNLYVDNLVIEVENTDPLIIASPTSVSMNAAPGGTATETVTVTGDNLTDGITATISGTHAALFSVSPASLGTTGGDLTITYSPSAAGDHSATLTLTSAGADAVTINLSGSCIPGTTYELVTDPSTQMIADKKYIIVHGNYAMGALNSNNYGTLVNITDNGNNTVTVPGTASAMVLTLHNYTNSYSADYKYSFTNDNGYLMAASGYSATLTTNTTAIDNASWRTVADTKNTGGYGIQCYRTTSRAIGYRENSSYSNFGNYSTSDMTANSTSYFYGLLYVEVDNTPKITASPETLTINDSGTNNTFTVQGSNLGTDNVGVTVPQGSEFSTTTTDQSWGFIPNNGSVSGTVTVTYNGRNLSATETVTATNNTGARAEVTVNYRADLYVVGDFGNGWDFSTGTLMTYNATNNTYTTNVTVNANNLILFARKLGESNPWNTRYVFGPNSDGDWWVNGDNATGTIDLYDDDPIKFVNAGTYTIEINATTGALTIYKMVLPPPENVVATPDGTNATVTWDVPSNLPTAIGPYTEDFEDTSKFPSFSLGGITATQHNGAVGGWTLYDSTGAQVYGDQDEDFENEAEPQAWMVFNSTSVGVPAHSGAQYMESICPLSSYGAADSWLISPELSGNAQTITFYEHVLSDSWGNELYEVLVSSTDNDPASFTSIKTFADVNLTWTLQTADLPAGTKYFAIRHYSNNVFGLLVDDITYEGATPVPVNPISYNVYLDGVLVGNVDANDPRSYDFSNLSSGEHNCAVSAVYEGGVESEQVPAQFTIVPKTDAPAITVTASGGSYTITATGNGTVTLTVGDQTVSGEGTVSITIPRTDADQTVTATATAQETGKLPSDPATREVTIPALPVDPTPESIGLLRLHLLFCDQLKEVIPDDNSHPDAYGYVLRWEPNGPTGDDARESGRVRVNIQKTDCEVLGYYTLDQIDMDKNIGINHDQGLTMDVTTAQVKFNLSSSNDKLNYYYLQGEENGLPELGEDYLSQLHRQEDFTYREMYTESAEFDEVFENGTHYYFNGGTPILTGVYGDATKYVSYAPSVTTWGIERRYFELDGYDNTYGGPIWKTSVGKVEMDTHDVTLKAERQTNASHSVNWTDENNQAASVYILDGIGAIGLLPHTDLTKVEFEPYMFRVFVESPNGKLRNYKFVDADPTNTTQPGEHAEGVTTSEADAKGPLCVWSGYVDYDEDGNMILEDSENGVSISTGTYENGQTTYIYHKNKVDRPAPTVVTDPETGETTTTVASWEKDKNNAMFGALDDVAISGYNQQTGEPILKQQIDPEDLTVFVRFYFNVKGMAAGHVPMGRAGEAARPGNGSESPGFAPEPWTAVNEVVYNGEVVSRTYVNALGMQSDQPFDGVNIVVTRYSDGKVSTTKVVH